MSGEGTISAAGPAPSAPPPAFVRLLRLAYSAERAAAFAYQGHATSVADPEEKRRIAAIEADEWRHRAAVLAMLERRGGRPSRWLEAKYLVIGRGISAACHLLGHFAPMYFAGRLESGNVNEYHHLIALADGTLTGDEEACLREMARVEKEHEVWFLSRIEHHWLMPAFRRIFRWGPGMSFNRQTLAGGDAGVVD